MYSELLIIGATISTMCIISGAYLAIYHPANKYIRFLLAVGSTIQWVSLIGIYYTGEGKPIEWFLPIIQKNRVNKENRRTIDTNYNEITPEQIVSGTVWTENPEENPGLGWVL